MNQLPTMNGTPSPQRSLLSRIIQIPFGPVDELIKTRREVITSHELCGIVAPNIEEKFQKMLRAVIFRTMISIATATGGLVVAASLHQYNLEAQKEETEKIQQSSEHENVAYFENEYRKLYRRYMGAVACIDILEEIAISETEHLKYFAKDMEEKLKDMKRNMKNAKKNPNKVTFSIVRTNMEEISATFVNIDGQIRDILHQKVLIQYAESEESEKVLEEIVKRHSIAISRLHVVLQSSDEKRAQFERSGCDIKEVAYQSEDASRIEEAVIKMKRRDAESLLSMQRSQLSEKFYEMIRRWAEELYSDPTERKIREKIIQDLIVLAIGFKEVENKAEICLSDKK